MENYYTLAQDSVLGSIIIDPRCAGEVLPALRPTDFDEGIRRDAFKAIRELYLDSAKIDPTTVLAKIANPDPACRTWVLNVMDTTPTAANVLEYAAIVRDRALLRKLGERTMTGPNCFWHNVLYLTTRIWIGKSALWWKIYKRMLRWSRCTRIAQICSARWKTRISGREVRTIWICADACYGYWGAVPDWTCLS